MDFNLLDLVWSPAGHMTVQMAAVVTILATQWLKEYLPDWKYTQLLALGIAIGTQMAAVAIARSGAWFEAAGIGVLGASVATFGYETLVNLMGAAGFGKRSE